MPILARTIGPAGSGKTTDALETMDKVFATGMSDPFRVGFVSFTRAARREAAARAADKFGVTLTDLEKNGWFRTLHSIAYRQLGIQQGELIAGSKEDNEWLRGVLGDEKVSLSSMNDDDDAFSIPAEHGPSSIALQLWGAARNFLVPLSAIWERAYEGNSRTPKLALCEAVVTVYESAKREAGRWDFTDLLMRFAGKRWSGKHSSAFEDVPPEGDDPGLPVWFIDEAQDTSLLASLVFQRLIRFAQWVYVSLDMWQELYRFAGADGRIFGECAVSKEKVLPVSYRCPSRIFNFAESIMTRAGHAPRACRANREGGEIEYLDWRQALGNIRVGQDTLVIARTNRYAQQIARYLDMAAIPWRSTKAGDGPHAPARVAGLQAIIDFRDGKPIDGEQVFRMMNLFPVTFGEMKLFERGAKTHYEDKEVRASSHKTIPLTIESYADAGMTRVFRDMLQSGNYVEAIEKSAKGAAKAANKHGIGSIVNPTVRLGTCHSCKGQQAEHVVVMNQIPALTKKAIENPVGMDEERRVWYVSASRAKEKLTIIEMSKTQNGNSFPDL